MGATYTGVDKVHCHIVIAKHFSARHPNSAAHSDHALHVYIYLCLSVMLTVMFDVILNR